MYFMKMAQERYSVRSFEDRPLSDEHINIILKTANAAPTGYMLSEVKKI